MLFLDTPTLLVTDTLVNATAGIMCFVWLMRRREGEFAFWGGGFLTGALASVVSALATIYPLFDIVQFFMVGVAIALYWAGYRYFDGLPPMSWRIIALTMSPGIVRSVFEFLPVAPIMPSLAGFAAFMIVIGSLVRYILTGAVGQPAERKVGGWAMGALVVALFISIILQFEKPDTQMGGFVVLLVDHATTAAFCLSMFAMSIDRAYRKIEHMACRDALTGTLNRSGLDAALSRLPAGGGVLVADLDHFKSVNDRFGHPAGDEVLCEFARRATQVAGKEALVGRMGGEEFVVVLPQGDIPATETMAQNIRSALVDAPVRWGNINIDVTVSIGVAKWSAEEDIGQAISRADVALYRAKSDGRDRIVA